MMRAGSLGLVLVLGACGAGAEPQAPRPVPPPAPVAAAAPATRAPGLTFDSARAWEHLRRQVEFGPRPAGSSALAECRKYIVAELKAAGLDTLEQAFDGDTPMGKIPMVNLRAIIPGRRPERIIIATHYDTKLFRDVRFVGASDGASSTAAVLELARALKGRSNEFTIELLFLDGEEAVVEWAGTDHTYGSRHYVAEAQRSGTVSSIKALVLLDMIGDRGLDIRRDSNSTPWLVDVVWAAAQRIGHRSTFVNDLTTIEDDHLAFVRAGIPSVDIIDLNYAEWHTPQDDLNHVSAASLQIVGDVVLAALPDIEQRLAAVR
ncbi:MAG: M28 family peptidase [Vicinamibacterales bacterium]